MSQIMFSRFLLIYLALLLTTFGCGRNEGGFKLPGVYRIDIQQGNVIDQEMIDKLKPGMDKRQVQFIMGTPPLIDPFHTERWDYIYTYSKRGRTRKQIHITLYFEDEKLAYLDGDVVTAIRKSADNVKRQSTSVDVPLKKNRQGFFSTLLNLLPFVGDDAPEPAAALEEDTTEASTSESNDNSDGSDK